MKTTRRISNILLRWVPTQGMPGDILLLLSQGVANSTPLPLLTYMVGSSCLVRCHSSSFKIFSGHLLPRILRRQPSTNGWILLLRTTVVFQVSAPYKRIDFTLELKMRTLVFSSIFSDFHTRCNNLNAVRAFPILILISSSEPPCWSTMLPSQ